MAVRFARSLVSAATATGRAHGKVILLGEHAVVYGRPALAAGIDRGARATAFIAAMAPGAPSTLTLAGRTIPANASSQDDLSRAFAALLAPPGGTAPPAPPVVVEASSELPPGGGLGSSAALAVAIARAIEGLAATSVSEPLVAARATAWERIFHGNPSGIDTAAAAEGGCLRFARDAGAVPLTHARDLTLCIGWSGASSSTREMVDGVARLREREPARVEDAFGSIAGLVESAIAALAAGDLRAFGERMDQNQTLLRGLGVSTEAIERLCVAARGAGALGAKLTGAGGGGSVLALVPSIDDEREHGAMPRTATAILEAWRRDGFDGFVTRVARASVETR